MLCITRLWGDGSTATPDSLCSPVASVVLQFKIFHRRGLGRTQGVPKRESDISYLVYGFDPAHLTCYKCPFCAGKLGAGTFCLRSSFYGLGSLVRRKLRRGQAQHSLGLAVEA